MTQKERYAESIHTVNRVCDEIGLHKCHLSMREAVAVSGLPQRTISGFAGWTKEGRGKTISRYDLAYGMACM